MYFLLKLWRFIFWNGLLLFAIWYVSQRWVASLLPFGLVGEIFAFLLVFFVFSLIILRSPYLRYFFFSWDDSWD